MKAFTPQCGYNNDDDHDAGLRHEQTNISFFYSQQDGVERKNEDATAESYALRVPALLWIDAAAAVAAAAAAAEEEAAGEHHDDDEHDPESHADDEADHVGRNVLIKLKESESHQVGDVK